MLFHRTKNKEICQKKWILSFTRNLPDKYGKKLLNMETGLNGATFKKVVHKKAEAKGELIGNKISKKSETKACT